MDHSNPRRPSRPSPCRTGGAIFVDLAMVTIGAAYLAAKQRIIHLQQEAIRAVDARVGTAPRSSAGSADRPDRHRARRRADRDAPGRDLGSTRQSSHHRRDRRPRRRLRSRDAPDPQRRGGRVDGRDRHPCRPLRRQRTDLADLGIDFSSISVVGHAQRRGRRGPGVLHSDVSQHSSSPSSRALGQGSGRRPSAFGTADTANRGGRVCCLLS
jgi:hypothetical protein